MSNKKKDLEEENILGVNSPLPGEEHETEEDWAKDEDVQEFLEWADKPGPWDVHGNDAYRKSYQHDLKHRLKELRKKYPNDQAFGSAVAKELL